MKIKYFPYDVCATEIRCDIIDDRVYNVEFDDGCAGNHFGIARLVEGMKVEDVIHKLSGIRCDSRKTSCPDQLAEALIERYGKFKRREGRK